jgi:primosomal protein N'
LIQDLKFVADRVLSGDDAIIYVPSIKLTTQLFRFFRTNFPRLVSVTAVLHSDMSAEHVARVILQWREAKEYRLLIATSLLSNVCVFACVLLL